MNEKLQKRSCVIWAFIFRSSCSFPLCPVVGWRWSHVFPHSDSRSGASAAQMRDCRECPPRKKRTKTSLFATNARKRVFSFTWQRCHANYRDDSAIPGGRESVLSHRRRGTISTKGGRPPGWSDGSSKQRQRSPVFPFVSVKLLLLITTTMMVVVALK